MASQWIRKVFWVQGMMLKTGEAKLERALGSLAGVRDVKASYPDETVWFSYDPQTIKLRTILKAIREIGYLASEKPPAKPPAPASRVTPENGAPKGAPPVPAHTYTLIRKILRIDGMTCTNCEMRIENGLKKTAGIREAKVSYAAGTAKVGYDPGIVKLSEIIGVIEALGYQVVSGPAGKGGANGKPAQGREKTPINQILGIGIILLAGYLIITHTIGFNFIPAISQNMGYGILFVIGLVTSIHCIAMCGGINLSQSVSYRFSEREKQSRAAKLKPSLLYNAGRVISYTVLGGIVGALGSVVSFSGTARGVVSIAAGVFMVIMGLNMLNVFPGLRRFMPHMPKVFARKLHAGGTHGPFFVGLFNGLMPCGPLQAMQIYALGTGSPVKGALSMLVFSLGTVPLMFGFGAVSSFLSSRFTHKMMKVSAALVIVLGFFMLNRGFSLSGFDIAGALTPKAAGAAAGTVATVRDGGQEVTTQLQANGYPPITVQKGIPVKWTIQADAGTINGCNGTVTIPQYHITKQLRPGSNEIDFTPQSTGTVTYTCSMGMIRSTISVVADVAAATAANTPASAGSSATGNSAAGAASGVGIAAISGNQQSVTVSVGAGGYSPNILVVQKGVPVVIHFTAKQLSSCNDVVVFPSLGGELDLRSYKSTPAFTPQSDFSFECGMGMLSGFVKVVDDIHTIDIGAIQSEAKNYVSSGGGMACCQ